MKKLLVLLASAGVLWYLLAPQWRSYERMGERRFDSLSSPQGEILVGVCWPFTVNQDGMANGLLLAQDEINSKGLANGNPVRLILREAFSWDEAKQIAIRFADTPEMSAVVGYYDDGQAIKASMIYESSRLLHLIVGANNTPMTAHGKSYIVRTILSGDKISRSLAKMTVERGRKRVALIWAEDAYGEDLAYQYRVRLDALGAQLVYQWSYSDDHPDFRAAVNELRSIDADLIFFSGLEPWAGDFLRMARSVGIRTEIMGAFTDTPLMRARSGPGLEGAKYFDFYDVNSATPENRAFVAKYKARYGKNPDAWAAQGYDALHLLAQAVKATSSRNPLDLSYAIRFMDSWEGANGRYKFDGHGEMEDKPLFLYEIRKGVPVVVQVAVPEKVPELSPEVP